MPAFDLVCDVGGTNIRFAAVDPSGQVGEVEHYALATFDDFPSAVRAFLEVACAGATPAGLAVGVAGPVQGGRVQMTNADWSIARDDLLGLTRDGIAVLVNDLPPVARVIPDLGTTDIVALRGALPDPSTLQAAIVVNVGTGLGAAALHRVAGGGPVPWHVVATEAGHIRDPQQAAAMIAGPVRGVLASYEDLVSGKGLAARSHGTSKADFGDARAVFARADEPAARQLVAAFATSLGGAVRDLILAHGAWDGAYLVGSVLQGWLDLWPRYPDASDLSQRDAFFAALDMSGPMSDRVRAVPIVRIAAREPALVGLASLLRDARYHHGCVLG